MVKVSKNQEKGPATRLLRFFKLKKCKANKKIIETISWGLYLRTDFQGSPFSPKIGYFLKPNVRILSFFSKNANVVNSENVSFFSI